MEHNYNVVRVDTANYGFVVEPSLTKEEADKSLDAQYKAVWGANPNAMPQLMYQVVTTPGREHQRGERIRLE